MALIRSRKPKIEIEKLSKRERVNALKVAVASHFSKNGYAPFFEVELDTTSRIRADVACIDYQFHVAIFEIKSSIEDFESDNKWQSYLPYCNYFYFVADEKTLKHIREKVEPDFPDVGFATLYDCSEITPDSLQILKTARKISFGNFSEPKYLYRFMRSGCLFFQGFHVGNRKINDSVLDERWNHYKKAEGK